MSRLRIWLIVWFAFLSSGLTVVNAQFPCGRCSSASPFQPFVFSAVIAMYGLGIYVFLNPKLPATAGRSIYNALRFKPFRIFRKWRRPRLTISTVAVVGLSCSLSWLFLTIPTAEAFDSGGGCGCGPSPFMPFQFVMELALIGAFFYLILAGREQRGRLFAAAATYLYKATLSVN